MDSRSTSAPSALDGTSVLDGAVRLGGLAAGLYGPDGRHKLVVTDQGTRVTGDLQDLFDALELTHPGALVAGRGAVQQKEAVGDGATAVLLLTRALAERAIELQEQGLHRASITDGFHRARAAATAAVAEMATPVDGLDDPRGRSAIRTALGEFDPDEATVDTLVDAARLVAAARQRDTGIGIEHVEFHHLTDAHAPRVELLRGLVLEREPITPNTPRSFETARVAVIGGGKKAGRGIEERELKRQGGSKGKGRTEVTVNATTPDDLTAFRRQEEDDVAGQVDRLVAADVDVVFTTMGISDGARAALDDAGITAFRGLQAGQARRVSRATGATVVMDIADFDPDDVGIAGRLRVETDDDGDAYVRIDRCAESEVGTLLVAGSVREWVTARQRAYMTAIVTGRTLLENGRLVPGGGGAWTGLAAAVRAAARSVSDRAAIAMDAYADALEDLPRTLARNAGVDELDVVADLRAGGANAVFDGETRTVRPVDESGPFDLAVVVERAVTTASEVAIRLVRIDEVLPARRESDDHTDYNFQPDPERDMA